jgi:hypothetical protein
VDCEGANLSSAAAFVGSWTPNGLADPNGPVNPTGSVNQTGLSRIKSGLAKGITVDEGRCLLVVENAEKSELICGQAIERVENK